MAGGTETLYAKLTLQTDALRIIFESLPVGVMVADSQGRLIFSNPAAESLLGLGPQPWEKAPGEISSVWGWYLPDQTTLISPSDLPLARTLRGEQLSDELIFVRSAANPGGLWLTLSGWPISDENGEIDRGVVLFHDVSGGRKAAQMIWLLSSVVQQTADSVMITDQQGRLEYVNPAFEHTTGYKSDEVLGLTPRFLKSGLHEDEIYKQLWLKLNTGDFFHGMLINRKKSGALYWTQQTITPVRSDNGQLMHFVSVSQDVTEIRQKQEQEFQLRLARQVQKQFYSAAPSLSGFDLAAAAYPAYETGGDYFDFLPTGDASLYIAVGDVEGHGFGSSLLMALTRAYIRSFASTNLPVDRVLEEANRLMAKDLESGRYVTLALAQLQIASRKLRFASAGHVTGYVLGLDGSVEHTLESTGTPLGLFPDSQYGKRDCIDLSSGQLILLLTDGVAESASPGRPEFGIERTLGYVAGHRHEPAAEIVKGLYRAARSFVNNEPQTDDLTAVIVKIQ